MSLSGYGEQCRFALRALRAYEDIFDIYLINIPWGQTGFITEISEERQWLDSLLVKTINHAQTANGGFAGEMFDGHGMLDAIAQTGAEIAKADVVICGAGAAGSAIGVEVVRRGARLLSILDRDPARAATLARQLADLGGTTVTTGLPQRADVLINASPAGSPGMAPPPFDAPLIAAADCVADALTDPTETALLRRACALGRRVVRGTDMAAAQADRMRQFLGFG